MTAEHQVELAEDPDASLELVSREATSWGAAWRRDGRRGGRLTLPVLAGLRRGRVEGEVIVEPAGAGSRLTFRIDKSDYRLQGMSVAVLLVAALGALAVVVGPFVPALRPAVPLGILLSVGAWLFIVAGLRNSGPEEFLEGLAAASPPVADAAEE